MKASLLAPDHNYWYGTSALQAPTASGMLISPDTAMRQTAVSRCVRLIGGTVALLPLKIYRNLGEDAKEVARNHPILTP